MPQTPLVNHGDYRWKISSFARQSVLYFQRTQQRYRFKKRVLRFEARREQNGLPAVTIRDLLKATLRHRPDRIILGEISGGEAFDLLQLLNTGHSGTLSTVHANSAAQGISCFTTCVLQSGVEMPYRAIKTNINSVRPRWGATEGLLFRIAEIPERFRVDGEDFHRAKILALISWVSRTRRNLA